MYINNLGNNLTALYRAENSPESFSQVQLERLQALNVSVLSILNCVGRMFSGLVSDQLKHRFGVQRSAFLVLSASLFVFGSVCVYSNIHSSLVVRYTSLVGFTYGVM